MCFVTSPFHTLHEMNRQAQRTDECVTIGRCKISRLVFAGGRIHERWKERQDEELDVRSGKARVGMRALHHTVILKWELSRKAKLSVFKSIFVLILIYGDESWVMTEKVRSQMLASEMRFLRKIKSNIATLRFVNLSTSSRYFSGSKDLSFNGLAM